MWLKYNELIVGPAPILEEGHFEETGRLFHTGRYVDGGWKGGYDIEFTLRGGSDDSADELEIAIFGVHDQLDFFSEGAPVKLKTGYIDYYDTVFLGRISSVEFGRDGIDNVTRLKCVDDAVIYLNGYIGKNFNFPYGTKLASAVRTLLEWSHIPIGYIHDDGSKLGVMLPPEGVTLVGNEYKYANFGASKTNSLKQIFDWWASDYGFGYFFYLGRFYWLRGDKRGYIGTENIPWTTQGIPVGWVMSYDTGLISWRETKDQDNETDVELQMMMIPGIGEHSIIRVQEQHPYSYSSKYWIEVGIYDFAHFIKVNEFTYNSSDNTHKIEVKGKYVSPQENVAYQLGNYNIGVPTTYDIAEPKLTFEEWINEWGGYAEGEEEW